MTTKATKTAVRRLAGLTLATLTCAAAPLAAHAAPSFAVSGFANIDISGAVSGPGRHRVQELDKEQINFDFDADGSADHAELITAHLSVMNTSGAQPNADVNTLQGVNNIEVGSHRLRLYEAWIEAPFAEGRVAILGGLYDLNSEFYASDSAGLLLAPAFGIGSELAATGSGGPSIFPSTSLAVRLNVRPTLNSYVRAAVFNARAGTVGDIGGVDTSFDEGVLAIAEAGYAGDAHFAIGVWRYSQDQDDLFRTDAFGNPLQRTAQGVYGMAERRIAGEPDGARMVTGFVRAGISDGRTGPFRGGAQAGVLVERVTPGRENSQLSLGLNVGLLGRAFRDATEAGGTPTTAAETQIELTYADNLGPYLQVQPDLQYTFNPGGVAGADGALVATIRFTLSYGMQD